MRSPPPRKPVVTPSSEGHSSGLTAHNPQLYIIPSEHWRLHGPLGSVVRHFEPAVGDIAGQRLPTRPGIADRLGERTLAAHPVERRVEERLQLLQQRLGVLVARGHTLIGWSSADTALDKEESGDWQKGLQGDRRGCGLGT